MPGITLITLSPVELFAGTLGNCSTFNSSTTDSLADWFQDSLADGLQMTNLKMIRRGYAQGNIITAQTSCHEVDVD